MQSKVDAHIQRAYDLLQMSARRKPVRQKFGVGGHEDNQAAESSSQQEKRARTLTWRDVPEIMLENLIKIAGTESQQKGALIKVGRAMSETDNAELLNKMLACVEFLTFNMYSEVMKRIFLEKIKPREELPFFLDNLQELAYEFVDALHFLKTEPYSQEPEKVRTDYEHGLRLIRCTAKRIHRELLIMVKEAESSSALRTILTKKNMQIQTFADWFPVVNEQLSNVQNVLLDLQRISNTSNITAVLKVPQTSKINKIFGCLEILSEPKHSAKVIVFAHAYLLLNLNQESHSLLDKLQRCTFTYLEASQSVTMGAYTLAEHYKGRIANINIAAKHMFHVYMQVARKQSIQPQSIADIMGTTQEAVASSSSSGQRRSPSADVKRQTASSSGEQALIQVFYDRATQEHQWETTGHQEQEKRIDWALEAFDISQVECDKKELRYTLEQEIPSYLLMIQNHYSSSSDVLPQIAELNTDTKEKTNPDGWPVNVDQSMLSVYASGNLIYHVVKEVQQNDVSVEPKRLYFVLTRPPGHHAHFDANQNPMNRSYLSETGRPRHTHGFCIFNNALVMTHDFTEKGYCVLLIDIDYHKGDGTPHVVWQMNQQHKCVEHVDVFCAYDFPNLDTLETYCKCIHSNGVNCKDTHSHFHGIPAGDFGSERQSSLIKLVKEKMTEMLTKQQPLVVIVQFGVDAHYKDARSFINPSKNWFTSNQSERIHSQYTPAITRDYYQLGATLAHIRKEYKFSVVCLLEGGYAQESLNCSIAGFVQGWSGKELSADLMKRRCGPDYHRRLL